MRNNIIDNRKYSTVYNAPNFTKLTVAQYRYVNLYQKLPILSKSMEISGINSLRTYLNHSCRSEYFHLTHAVWTFFVMDPNIEFYKKATCLVIASR